MTSKISFHRDVKPRKESRYLIINFVKIDAVKIKRLLYASFETCLDVRFINFL